LRAEKKAEKAAKELAKRTETPEQKLARRIAKKSAKDAKRQEAKDKKKAAEADKFAGYTNDDNPFGDTNLGEKFVWHKKQEAGLHRGISVIEQERRAKELAQENAIELEKVKLARAEREAEMEAKDEEKRLEQQEKENELFKNWLDGEDAFLIENARQRTVLRMKDGRAKPIDILCAYIQSADVDNTDMDMKEPYLIFTGLETDDLEDLHADIGVYEKLDDETHPEFWEDMKVLAEYELRKKRREAATNDKKLSAAQRRALDTGVNATVAKKITSTLKDKSVPELQQLMDRVVKQLASGVDINYWEYMKNELVATQAKARLRENHQQILEDKLMRLKEKSQKEDDNSSDDEVVFDESDLMAIAEEAGSDDEEQEENIEPDLVPFKEVEREYAFEAAEKFTESKPGFVFQMGDQGIGYYEESEYRDLVILDPEADVKNLLGLRRHVLFHEPKPRLLGVTEPVPAAKPSAAAGNDSTGDAFVQSQKGKGMAADECLFDEQVEVKNTRLHLWRDKYKPRKPRFFNRVHTGFEWNKYNQTHYDSDNPPPKIVQGYKFNIFYPDLIDRSQTPDFELTPIPNEPGFAILRFMAGAPYDDLAFKVVDRPWEYAHRRGFRSQFQHKILQVWFHFRRERYRR